MIKRAKLWSDGDLSDRLPNGGRYANRNDIQGI